MTGPRLPTTRLLACVFLLLSGCAAHRAEIAARAHNELPGMPKAELLRCMGPPTRQESVGEPEVLVWSGTTPDHSCPFAELAGDGATPRRCEVRIRLERGIVRDVDYHEPGGRPIGPGDQCTFLVEDCVK